MKSVFIIVLCLVGSLVSVSAQATGLTLTMVDVDHAECILITVDQKAMIVDTGYAKSWEQIYSTIQALEIDSFEYLVLTHPHADHIGCATRILDCYEVGTVMLSPATYDSKAYEKIELALAVGKIETEYPQVGQQYSLGAATFTVYGPHPVSYPELNDWSIVLMLEYAGRRILLTGDIEAEAEYDLLAFSSEYPLDADILKVAHHGSNTSSTYQFIEAVSPQYAIVSCPSESDSEYPHVETAMTLYECGVEEVFTTNTMGDIEISISKDGIISVPIR